MIRVIIITTGDELLYGTTADTNSAYISSAFYGTNLRVIRHVTVSDSIEDITGALTGALAEAEVVILTGGLGPTDDDNTVESLCRLLGIRAVPEPGHLEKMKIFFSSMNMPDRELDIKMVSLPEGSRALANRAGLAPGFIIERDGRTIISLPGVPAEMEPMFTAEVMPYITEKYGLERKPLLSYRISGIRESEINAMLRDILSGLDVRFSITPKSGVCDLILVPSEGCPLSPPDLEARIKEAFRAFLIADSMGSPEEELVSLLKEKGMTISTAESCTGGLLAKRITDIAGSSEVFTGSVVAYSNSMKVNILGVKERTLEHYGAVSEKTAGEMASGLKRCTGSDICISITGIAGPSGGTAEKPVGMVCFGFIIKEREFTVTRVFSGSRERVRTFASLYVLNRLRNELRSLFFD